MCRDVAGSVCRWGARRGACPAGRRLTVPFRNPQGGLPFGLPAAPDFSLLFCPHPPSPLPLRGRGSQRLFHARGSAPCIPGAEPTGCRKTDRTAFLLAVPPAKERGDRGRWNYPSQATAAFEMVLSPGAGIASAAGGLPFLSPANPAFSLLFCPHPPDPLPLRGRGSPRLFHARGSAPCIPGAEPSAAREKRGEPYARQGACLLGYPPPLTLVCFFAPIPPDPLPGGKGETKVISCKGLCPLHPRA